MSKIVIKVATDPDYWGSNQAPTEDDWLQLEQIIDEVALDYGYDEIEIKKVPEVFSYANENTGDAWEILDEAWWKFVH